MFDSGMRCATGLVLASAVLFCLVRWLSISSSEDSPQESPHWVKVLIDSKAGIAVQVLLAMLLAVSVGSITGVILWEAIKGIAGTVAAAPEVFLAAIVGAAASMIGFGLFGLVLSLLGPVLFVAIEEWTAYVAPVIGGTVGGAIGGGLAPYVIYIVALSALTGGITATLYGTITAKKRITFKAINELVIAGVGLGAINGIILAIFFKVLEVTVGSLCGQ